MNESQNCGGVIKLVYEIDQIKKEYSKHILFMTSVSWLITVFVTGATRRVSLVEQELLSRPEQLSSPPVFVGFVLLDL